MTTIITANIGGTVFTADEDAYDALRHYLIQAKARLRTNPDQPEIVADLERSIADKLTRRAGTRTGAVSKVEVLEILHEIGMVEGDETDPAAKAQPQGSPQPPPEPRRLYRIHEGEHIAGVCTGLAAYAELDVTLVRVLFVLLTIFSGGVGALIYLVMMFAVPVAHPAQSAAPATARP
jgi:phage shock protein PspC (stress-responsive transcriptional regulator)